MAMLFLVLAALAPGSTWCAEQAQKYWCENPPDKRATLAVWSNYTVTITRRDDTKECFISVNGASVNSPPQERLDASLGVLANAIRTAPTNVAEATKKFSADLLRFAIADLLSPAVPGNEIATELVQKLSAPATIEMTAHCMALFAAGDAALEPSETGGSDRQLELHLRHHRSDRHRGGRAKEPRTLRGGSDQANAGDIGRMEREHPLRFVRVQRHQDLRGATLSEVSAPWA
jgi:hypothetical protein